jgi:ankyrin repeat protein
VADFLIKAGADIELGCSTPLMEAAQEGHLELVKYLLTAGGYRPPEPREPLKSSVSVNPKKEESTQ